MSDPTLRLPIESSFNARGTDAAEAALRRMQQLQASAKPSGAAGDQGAAAAARAAAAQQNLATATQRTEAAASQAAVAAQRLATEEQRTAAAASGAAAAQARAETAALRLAKAQEQAAQASQRGAGFAQQLGSAYTSSLMSIVGPAAIAAASLRLVGEAGELIQLGAQADQTRQRFDGLAASAHTTGEALLGAMRAASAGTISDLNLELAANRAQLLGVADSAQEFSTLMEIARDRAQDMGISITQAFNDLVTGLGRGSALILDNLGITVSVTEANKVYADQLHKNASALTEAEQKQALINAVLAQGKASLAASGGAIESQATKLERLSTNWENVKAKVGGFLGEAVAPTVEGLNVIAAASDRASAANVAAAQRIATQSSALQAAAKNYTDYAAAVAKANDASFSGGGGEGTLPALTEAQFNYAKSLEATGLSAEQARAAAIKMNSTFVEIGQVQAVVKEQGGLSVEQLDQLSNTILHLNEAGGQGAAQVNALSAAFLNGQLSPQQFAAAVQQIQPALEGQAAAAQQAAMAAQIHSSGMDQEITAAIQAQAAILAANQALADATVTSMADAAAKEELAAKTSLVTAQTEQAISAFLALNPNLTASGAAAAAGAAGFSPLISRLIEATLRATEARNALALFNALSGIRATAPRAAEASRGDVEDIRALKINSVTEARKKDMAAAQATAEAERHLASVQGNEVPTIQHLRNEAEALRKTRGAGSADYINKLAEIETAEKRQAANVKRETGGGGRGGGGAAGKAEKAAEATATRLEDIQRTSGNKLADIDESTQGKLAAIEAKYAAQRVKAQQDLANQIAEANADVKYDQTLDNFDAFQKDMSKEQLAAFRAREAAEAHYNERVASAQEQARQEAQSGDATLAQDKLKIRTDEAKKQQEIEERAAKANADTGGKQQAAVAATAKQASDAAKQEADAQIAIAEAKAAERAGAEQAEKDAVIASANDQKDKVISAATEQATRVKGASEDQKQAVISALQAQASAASAWASSIESASSRAQAAMDGVTGPSSTTGDATGDTSADSSAATSSQSTQGISRASSSSSSSAGGDILATLQSTVTFIGQLLPLITHQNELVKQLRTYEHTVIDTVKVLQQVADLHKTLAQPLPALPAGIFDTLAAEITQMITTLATKIDPNLAKYQRTFEHILGADRAAVAVFTEIVNLRKALADPPPPLLLSTVTALADEAEAIVKVLQQRVVGANQRQEDDLKRYAEMVSASTGIVQDIADLRRGLSEAIPPLDMTWVNRLANDAQQIVRVVQTLVLPFAEQALTTLQSYATAVSASVGVLKDVADLRRSLAEGLGPDLTFEIISRLASDAQIVTRVVQGLLLPETEAQAADFARYADVAGRALGILKDVADLRRGLAEGIGADLYLQQIERLASDALIITRVVESLIEPTTEAQAAALSAYADAAGRAIGILKDVADLRKGLVDVAGPLDPAKITALANEALAVARVVSTRLLPVSEDEAAAMERYGQTVGAVTSAIKDVTDLRSSVADLAPPLTGAQIGRLAAEAKKVTEIVLGQMVPVSEDQAKAARQFADTEGAAIAALKSVLDLPAQLFADYQSPSNAQIDRVVSDANRIVQRVNQAAKAYDTKGLEAAKAFGEATGSVISAFKDELLFAQALASGDFVLNPANLAKFEQGMAQTLATAGRLGSLASAIPAADISALSNAAAALDASYSSMIKLSAVPAGNLSQLAGGFAAGVGGGRGGVTVTIAPGAIVINGAGQNGPQIADLVMRQIGQRVGARR